MMTQDYLRYETPITLSVEDVLNPEEKANVKDDKLDDLISNTEEIQNKKDDKRQLFIAGLGFSSKQRQAEIYMSVALDEAVSLGNSNTLLMESLEKLHVQNNFIKATAAYEEEV